MTDTDPVDKLRPAMRVVVRRRIEHGVTDALGDLVEMDADTVSIRTRSGLVVINRADVVAAKEVPPRPSRRGAAHLAISMRELERTMVQGWPPVERAELGDWILRAAAGFTGRANSVLACGDPGVPLSEAVELCERWYDERGLRRTFSLFGPKGFALDQDPLGQELLDRGYEPFKRTAVMTTSTRALPPEIARRRGESVLLEPTMSPPWWGAFTNQRWPDDASGTHPAARAVLSGSPEQLFASLEHDGAVIGIARVAFAQSWAGVSALHVNPDHRRRGVAMQLVGAVADASRARGIQSVYLQVVGENSTARSLFDRLGFSTHHEYCYLGG